MKLRLLVYREYTRIIGIHLIGGMRYQDGNESNGFVLTSDANGLASWQPAAAGLTDHDWYYFGTTAPPTSISAPIVRTGRIIVAPKYATVSPRGRLRIEQGVDGVGAHIETEPVASSGIGLSVVNKHINGPIPYTNKGAYISCTGGQNTNYVFGLDVYSETKKSPYGYGIKARHFGKSDRSYGGHFENEIQPSQNAASATGVYGKLTARAGFTGNTYGGFFYNAAEGSGSNAVNNSYGVYGFSLGGVNKNYGGCFIASHNPLHANQTLECYGIWAEASGGTSVNRAGYFNGDVEIPIGNIYMGSDKKLKTDIEDLSNGLEIVNQLHPVSYKYRKDEFPDFQFDDKLKYGLIAQELKQILPDLTDESVLTESRDDSGKLIRNRVEYLSVNYIVLIPYLIKAIQEQQEQQEQIEELKAEEGIKDGTDKKNNQTNTDDEFGDVELSVSPNPNDGEAMVSYFTTQEDGLTLYIYDLQGTMIEQYNNLEKAGEVELAGEDLNPGMYYCSLYNADQE